MTFPRRLTPSDKERATLVQQRMTPGAALGVGSRHVRQPNAHTLTPASSGSTTPVGAVVYQDPSSYTSSSNINPSSLVRTEGDGTWAVYDATDPGVRLDESGWYQVEGGFDVSGSGQTQPVSMRVNLPHGNISIQFPVSPGWNDASGSSAPFFVDDGTDLPAYIDGSIYNPGGSVSVDLIYVRIVKLT